MTENKRAIKGNETITDMERKGQKSQIYSHTTYMRYGQLGKTKRGRM